MNIISKHCLKQLNPHSLNPHPDNPRQHSKAQISQIAKSIQTFGFKIPILVDSNHQIIAGHGRVEASKQLNLKEIPALIADDLSPIQARALMLADNKLTENATWDEALLAKNFQILDELELNFDLDVTGFEYGEIEQFLVFDEEVESQVETVNAIDPALPLVSQAGDIWQLNEHYIICGNGLKAKTYQDLLGEQKAHLIFSDPPYNLPSKTIGKICDEQHGDFQFASGEMSKDAFIEFLSTIFFHCCNYSEKGSIHYHCMDWRHMEEILSAGKHYDELKNICVWTKDRAGMGAFYRSQHEMILVFKHGKTTHQNNFKLGQHGRYRTNVWSYPAVRVINDTGQHAEDALSIHPTIKPVAMIVDALKDCSKRHQIVLDPFLGSGSTLIACEQTKRRCYGIEIEPRYVDASIRRWQKISGVDAICNNRDNQSFDALQQQEGGSDDKIK